MENVGGFKAVYIEDRLNYFIIMSDSFLKYFLFLLVAWEKFPRIKFAEIMYLK